MESTTNKFKYKQSVVCYKDGNKFLCNGYAIGTCQDYNALLVAIKRPNPVSANHFQLYAEAVQGVDPKIVMVDFPNEKYSFWAFDLRRIQLANDSLEKILNDLEDEIRIKSR